MNKKFFIIVFFLFCYLLLTAAEVIFHCTSDIHGVLFAAKERGCMAKLASYFEVSRNQEDITVDCGDLLQGSYDANSTQGDLIVRAFNLLNYDFFVPGNHDLEFGAASLRRNLEKMKLKKSADCNRFSKGWPI